MSEPALSVRLTGRTGLRRGGDGPGVEAGGPGGLGRLAFAYLVVHRGRPVPREELAEVLWGDRLPRTWDTSLRVIMSRLRTWLETAGLDRSEALTSALGCYQLHLPAATEIDVEEAADALVRARAALEGADPAAARAEAERAVRLAGRGFLPGGAGPWVERQQAAWEDLGTRALETLAEAALAAGDAGAALAAADQAVARQPIRESAHLLRIRAHAAAGNRGEALRAYEGLRQVLADELGVPPSPLAEAAYLALLRDGGPAPVPPGPVRLPAALSSLVGRDADVEGITARLLTSRLVSLVATAGLGKTRLALEVARRTGPSFTDGATFVSLAEVLDARAVAGRALEALGEAEEPTRAPEAALAEVVADRHLLLVLDNCEHVVDAAAALVARLLQAAPRLTVLATSREPLGVPGEQVWRVPPLSPADAERLFVERASAGGGVVGPDASVATVCRRLDGIPLAIELAAARAGTLPPAEIAARLDDRFQLLTGGARTSPERHRSLAAAIDWTYDALPAGEQHLLQRLSRFAGPFSLDAVEAVAHDGDGAGAGAVDTLGALVARSLVQVVGDGRYRLLETIRSYAAGKRDASGDGEDSRLRLVAWAADLAERAEARLSGPEQAVWLDRLESDHANLLGALAVGGGSVDGLRLAAALGRFWEMRGRLHEGRDRLRAVLAEAPDDAPLLLRARAENAAALLAQRQGDYAAAASRLQQSLSLRRRAGDRLGVAVALHGLGNLAALEHDTAAARRLYQESLVVAGELGDAAVAAAAHDNLGWVAHAEGDFARARRSYEQALALHRQAGDEHGAALVLGHLGDLAYQQGDYAQAASRHEESLVIRTALGDRAGRADSLATLGHLAMDGGALAQARALLGESLAIRRELGDRAGLPDALISLADLALLTGDRDGARVPLEAATAAAEATRDGASLGHVLVHRGRLALAEGRPGDAARHYADAQRIAGGLGRDTVTAEWLEGSGAALVAGSGAVAGTRLLAAASRLRDALGAPVPPYERPMRQREIVAARAALGDDGFAAAWAAGRALTLDGALAEAGRALRGLAAGARGGAPPRSGEG